MKRFKTTLITLLYVAAVNAFGFWAAYRLVGWLVSKLHHWNPSVTAILLGMYFAGMVVGVAIFAYSFKMLFDDGGDGKQPRDAADYLMFALVFGKDFVCFFMFFVSFGYLCWELQNLNAAHFSGAPAAVGPWMRYVFLSGVNLIDSDTLEVWKISLPQIVPQSTLAKLLVWFFHLYIKLVIAAFLVRVLVWLGKTK
ncbi:MAG TPA: hypothetical protein VLT83_02815 [Opitutaceae bacterium]|nr:hypothetical protein [Opitutaceae bacterium]